VRVGLDRARLGLLESGLSASWLNIVPSGRMSHVQSFFESVAGIGRFSGRLLDQARQTFLPVGHESLEIVPAHWLEADQV
jgi:hypothetical protein